MAIRLSNGAGVLQFYQKLYNNGNAYIDTGIKVLASDTINFKLNNAYNPLKYFMGVYSGSSTKEMDIRWLYGTSDMYYVCNGTPYLITSDKGIDLDIELGNNSLICNDVSRTVTMTDTDFSWYLFAKNGYTTNFVQFNLYYFKITRNGNTLINLIPCKLLTNLFPNFTADNNIHYANECGLWDTIHNKFYGNVNNIGVFEVNGDALNILDLDDKIDYLAYATTNNQLVYPKKLYWANSRNSVQLVYIRPELKENVDYVKYVWLKGSSVNNELDAPFIDSNYSIFGKNEFEIEIIAQTEPPQKSIGWSKGNTLFIISPNTNIAAYISHSWIQGNGVLVNYGHIPSWNYNKDLNNHFYYHVNEKINIHVIRENNVNKITINYNDGMSISVNNSNVQVQQIFDLIKNVIIAKISDKIKVHYCKIVGYCELHPCKLLRAIHPFQASDFKIHYENECGMWDSVNNIFYGNANKPKYPFDVTNDSGVIAITNPSFYNYFSSYVTKISDIRFTNIIPNSVDVVDNNIIDITGEGSIIKSYMWLINNGNSDYIGYIGSEYYDAQNNNVFWVEGEISNIFRNLSKNEIDILEHFNFSYATNPYSMFYSSKVKIAGRESVINNMRKDLYWQNSFYYYLGRDGIDIAACDFKNKTELFLWGSANKFVNYENFDCSTMLSLNGFFYANTNLDFSSAIKNWNVSNVRNIKYLFANSNNETCVKYLNIENWDLRKCTESRYVFKHEIFTNPINEAFPDWIKTPAYSPQTAIDLVCTYYNADGTVYGNSIPANSVGSVRIYRTQALAAQFNSAITFVNKGNDNLTLVEYLENNTTYTIPTLQGYTAVVTDNNGNTYSDGNTITINQDITLTFVWTAVNNNE